MASIDSGVDTGNDSNDSFAQETKSLMAQSESQSNAVADSKDFIESCEKYPLHCRKKNFVSVRL